MIDAPEGALILKILGTLNQAQARWFVAKEALALGRGGLKRLHELTGMSHPTILKGMREFRCPGAAASGLRWRPLASDGTRSASWTRRRRATR